MNLWDILILFAVAAMLFFALRAVRGGRAGSCHDASRRSGGCSCGGGCASCGGSCGSCAGCAKRPEEDR